MTSLNYTKKNLLYIFYLPIIINFVLNLIRENTISKILNFNIYNTISTCLLFVFLYLTGSIIKNLLWLPYISTGILIYLFSFFIFDSLALFVYTGFKHAEIFIMVNILWLLACFYKGTNKYKLLLTSSILLIANQFNSYFLGSLTRNKNIIGDVKDIHYTHVGNIYSESFYFSMNTPVLEGYPQLIAYLQATLNRISITQIEFEYLASSINVLYLLTILTISEVELSNESKLVFSLIFTSLVFNSEWLKILFIDSLMAEGLLSYVFFVILVSLGRKIEYASKDTKYVFLLLGLLYMSKQFISLLALLIICSCLIYKSTRRYAFYGMVGIILKELSYQFYFKYLIKNYHLKEIDFVDTVFDLLLLRDLKLENLKIILENLYYDKPFSLVLAMFFTFMIAHFYKQKLRYKEVNFYTLIILLNFIFIFTLYVSIWRNMELESPIRYMLNLLHITIFTQLKVIDKY